MDEGGSNNIRSEAVAASRNDGVAGASTDRAVVPRKKMNKLWSTCIFILAVELCERLCYYTIQGSQRNFLEVVGPVRNGQRGLQASAAVSLSSCWSMLSYLSCMLGGYIADNRLGRYRTILYFAQAYVVGVALVAMSAYPTLLSSDAAMPLYLVGTLVFVAIGTGAIKPNVMNFGADQYDTSDPEEREQQKRFFSYFYLTINLGVLGANGYTSNLATSESTRANPGSGYFESYVIAASAMVFALLIFVIGTPRYTKRGGVERGSVFSIISKHLVVASETDWKAVLALLGWCLTPLSMCVVLAGSLLSDLPLVSSIMTWTGMGVALAGSALLVLAHLNNEYVRPLDGRQALSQSGRSVSVEDVRGALACVPTIVSVNLGFNIVYNAMNNAYPAQACQMDTRIFGTQLNGSFFGLGDAFAIIIFVPIIQNCIFPALTRLRSGRPVTRWAQYTVGFGFGMLANLSAAYMEHVRRGMSTGENPNFVACPADLLGTGACADGYLLSKCSPNASLPMTNMSAFWAFVPMALTGLGEILVNPVIYQFVFEHAPSRLCSTVQALNLVFAGAVSNAVTAGLGPLVPENLNVGHINYYFYTNVVLAFLGLMVYWCVARPSDYQAHVVPTDVEGRASVGPLLAGSLLASEHRGASLIGSRQASLFARDVAVPAP